MVTYNWLTSEGGIDEWAAMVKRQSEQFELDKQVKTKNYKNF